MVILEQQPHDKHHDVTQVGFALGSSYLSEPEGSLSTCLGGNGLKAFSSSPSLTTLREASLECQGFGDQSMTSSLSSRLHYCPRDFSCHPQGFIVVLVTRRGLLHYRKPNT
ncbi:hypothetical protein BS78_04G187800 [Paspalum vaginatum]|nr:hypothetical protein BS78_04G187800 [Paspalum vaginatum]